MEFFKWEDSYNIGIVEIDRQHREFLELLNEYHEVLAHVKRATVGTELVDKLKLYIANHFKYEENLFETVGYRETEHLDQHKLFETRVAELENAHAQGSDKMLDDLLIFLRDWFLKHILGSDRKYASFVLSR